MKEASSVAWKSQADVSQLEHCWEQYHFTVKLRYVSDIGFSLIHKSVHYKPTPLSTTTVSCTGNGLCWGVVASTGQDCGCLVTVVNSTVSTRVTEHDALLISQFLQLGKQQLLIQGHETAECMGTQVQESE